MNDLVTVVIPTFNRARSLGRAIDSVLAQTYTNFELIVVDDGSTDNTPELLARFANRIQVIRQPNSGPSVARNTGIRAARGKFIAFLDSDDEWLPEKLEQQVPLMHDERIVLSVTNWRSAESTGPASGFDSLDFNDSWVCDRPSEFVLSRPDQRHIMLSSWLVRRDTVVALGGFNLAMVPVEDNDLLFRLAFAGSFALTKRVLLIRETGMDSVKLSRPGTLKYHRRIARAMCLAIANARVLAFSESKSVQRQFARAYAYFLWREMEFAALDGRTWETRRRAVETLTHNPGARAGAAACLGFFAPFFLRWRMRKKYAA
jgi:glycosyltransferase involved in cell wall biosynthesis